MAILAKAPVPPRRLNQLPNYSSALLALKLVRIIRGSERGRISEALRKALTIRTRGKGVVSVQVPHYWAPFYHDGRGPARARPGRWLVWFKDPGDDPRWGPGLPVLRREIRRLTKEEFQAGLEENRRRGRQNPFMIVRKVSGPGKANPFFERGFRALEVEIVEVDAVLDDTIGDILDQRLRTSKARPFLTGTATARL